MASRSRVQKRNQILREIQRELGGIQEEIDDMIAEFSEEPDSPEKGRRD